MQRTAIQLKRPNTVAAAELLLDELSTHESGALDLRIPHKLVGDDLGGLVASLQVIATWAQRNPNGRLQTYVNRSDVKGGLTKLLESDHGLFAVLMAPTVLDVNGNEIVLEARHMAIRRLDHIADFPSARHGSQALIAAADHTSRSTPSALYTSPISPIGGKLRSESAMSDLVKQFGSLPQVGRSSKRGLLNNIEPIAQIIHELFDNTHRYARHEADGLTAIQPSVRLIRAEAIGQSLELVSQRAIDQPALRTFLKHASHESIFDEQSAGGGMRRFLELSVLDTGPGIASRRLLELGADTDVSEQTELSALIDCLRKHVSTSSNAARGLGLDHVQTTLTNLRGYVRIRTGRIELTRDFISSPYVPAEDQKYAWNVATLQERLRSRVCGSLVTMLIPTNHNGDN